MKELDELLLGYMDRDYPAATPEARQAFERLLELENTEITALVFGSRPAADAATADVIDKLRNRPGN